MGILDRLRMWRVRGRPLWADTSTNERDDALWAWLSLSLPLKNLELELREEKKNENRTLVGCVLDLLFW